MMQLIRKPFQILLVCFAVLSLYYVTIFSEISLLDDRDAIIGLLDIEHVDLKSVFLPKSVNGGYYRPLIAISYLIDKFVWGLEPRIMHFENIIFHLVNVVLLFFVATELMRNEVSKKKYLPLITALLFAVHPLATESVNWISGRTDLLVGIFLLLSTYILIKFRNQRRWWYWPAITGCLLLGMFAKETAVAFIFVNFFLYRMKDNECEYNKISSVINPWQGCTLLTTVCFTAAVIVAIFTYNFFLVLLIILSYGVILYQREFGISRKEYLRFWIYIGVSLLAAVSLFFVVRKFVFVSDVASIPRTLALINTDPMYAFKVYTGAVGFYVKKFLFPFPLNLAIREIDPLYELLGILVLLLSVLCLRLGGVVSALALSGLCLVAPGLPLSMGTLAWTAYAERYVYLAVPFWLLAIIIGLNRAIGTRVWIQQTGMVFAGICLVFWTVGTYKRNLIWQTNLGIFDDTVRKSPRFKVTRGLYMLALYENEKYDEALEQYRIASELPSLIYDEKFDVLYALIQMKKGHENEARLTLEKVLQKKETVSVLENLIKLLSLMRNQHSINEQTRQKTDLMIVQYYEKLYDKTGDAMYLYRLGQDRLNNGMRAEAKANFIKAATELPENSEYKLYARNLAKKL